MNEADQRYIILLSDIDRELEEMTPDERVEFFMYTSRYYCCHCGYHLDKNCHCSNDE